MSFHSWLKDHRGHFIDHRLRAPDGPGVTIEHDALAAQAVSGGGPGRRRGRGRRGDAADARFRYVRPAFAPSPWTDPLPYEDPLERAARYGSGA